jgi:hypothetical protein
MVKILPTLVIGSFKDTKHAVRAIDALFAAGFRNEQVGLVSKEWAGEQAVPPDDVELQEKAGEGAVAGAATGAGLGAVAGALGAGLVPGVGPVLAGGLLTVVLGGTALGAAAGTFLGPFVALGLSEEEAQRHTREVEAGHTVVLVQTEDRQEEARTLLLGHGAYDDRMGTEP